MSLITGVSIHDVRNVTEELIYREELFEIPDRLDLFGAHHVHFRGYKSVIPELYVRSIKDSKCIIGREEIFTSDNQVVLEYTTQDTNPFIGLKSKVLNSVRNIDGVVVNLSLSSLENNYYHWLTECLARLYLLRKSALKPDYYIFSTQIDFQREYLDILGIEEEKILHLKLHSIIQASETIIPSFINNWEIANFRGYISKQKVWLPHWIGDLYKEKLDLKKKKVDRKIYISRSAAEHRRIENEHEILGYLEARSYEIVTLEKMIVAEQIEIFSAASIVLGLHGAGFSNIYFCPENTIVCEIFSGYYHDSSYKILAHALNLRYTYLIGESKKDSEIHPQKEDVYVNPRKFEFALRQLESILNS
jgi:capsular polysaccharide biosynthesis protein